MMTRVDACSGALEMPNHQMNSWGIFELMRRQAQAFKVRKPQPVKAVWAIGSMEWDAEQKKGARTAASAPAPYPSRATQRHGATTEFVAGETKGSNPAPPRGVGRTWKNWRELRATATPANAASTSGSPTPPAAMTCFAKARRMVFSSNSRSIRCCLGFPVIDWVLPGRRC